MTELVPIDGRVWRRVARLIETRYQDEPRTRRRIEKIAKGYLSGLTCTRLSSDVGLTSERVRQILRHLGIKRTQGGVSLRAVRKRTVHAHERRRKQERLARRDYGCSYEDVERVISEWRALSPAYRKLPYWKHSSPLPRFRTFVESLRRRMRRPIELTLPEWWAMWRDSGYWKLYGRGPHAYHMEVRHPDRPITPRNLVIVPHRPQVSTPAKRSKTRVAAVRMRRRDVRTAQQFRGRGSVLRSGRSKSKR